MTETSEPAASAPVIKYANGVILRADIDCDAAAERLALQFQVSLGGGEKTDLSIDMASPARNFAATLILSLFKTLGVTSLSLLAGRPVRLALLENRVVAFGNIVEDVWVRPDQIVADLIARENEDKVPGEPVEAELKETT